MLPTSHVDLISSGTWQGLQLELDIKTNMCYNEIGPFAHNVLTILGSIVNMIGRAYVIISHLV
jgi:hypothetical protein